MRNLTPVVFDDEGALRAVIPRKNLARRGRLNNALSTILARYTEYAASVTELSAITASSFIGDLIKDCQSFYSSETEEMSALRKAIFDSQPVILRSLCQYCAINEPNTLDHYASKGHFPEFSMFSLNLIPCCGRCNLDKGEQWTEKGHRHFVNLYYDTFISHSLLKAELRFEPNGEMAIEFSFSTHPNVTATQLSIIKSHFEELDLNYRHIERAIGVIAETRKTICRLDVRLGVIYEMLLAEADSKAELLGQNYWQVAVYRCLAASDRFAEECLGDEWLARACAEVVHLLASPVSPATSESLRRLVETRAWRRYINRGLVDGHDWEDWFLARTELGLPQDRLL